MPFKRKSRFKPKARRIRRRPRRSARSTVGRVLHYRANPVPDRMFLKLAYSTSVNTAGLAGFTDTHIFQSSQFDPDLSGTGHQPFGRDQWANFYSKYRVHAIGYKIIFANEATGSQAEVHVVPKSTASTITVSDTAWEKPYGKHAVLGFNATGQSLRTIIGYVSGAKALGVSKIKFRTDDKTGSAFGTNPAQMFYIHVISNGLMVGDASNVNARVNLTYYLEYYDRVPLTQS